MFSATICSADVLWWCVMRRDGAQSTLAHVRAGGTLPRCTVRMRRSSAQHSACTLRAARRHFAVRGARRPPAIRRRARPPSRRGPPRPQRGNALARHNAPLHHTVQLPAHSDDVSGAVVGMQCARKPDYAQMAVRCVAQGAQEGLKRRGWGFWCVMLHFLFSDCLIENAELSMLHSRYRQSKGGPG